MNVKKTFTIILLFLLLFSTLSAVAADDDRSYTIDQAFVDLTVENNGLLHVDERYDYSFEGKFNGVYRDIPLKAGESIENIQVYVDGAYAKYEESDDGGYKHIKVYLYSDEACTHGIRDCDVSVYLSYDMKNVVTLFNDVGGLQYKLWGDEWDVGVGSVDIQVKLPGDKGNEYFLNPQEFNVSSELDKDTITAKTSSIPKGDFYEILVLMPLDDFSDATYAKHVDQNGKEMIMKNLNDSINGRNFWNTTYLVLGLLSIFSPIVAVFTYLRYGREPKVMYEGIYERELPSDDPPEVVNAIYANGDIGTPNMDGFEAAILNLIDKKALGIETVADSETETNDLYIKFSGDTSGLKSNEKQVYDILHRFANKDRLNLSSLNSRLSTESNAEWFMDQYSEWQENVSDSIESRVSEEFNDTGTTIVAVLGVGGLVIGVIMAVLGFWTELKSGTYAIAGGIFLILFSLLIMKMDDDKFGQWTPEGRVMYLKWKNFKKFLKDNSLIKEHPPESIVIWRKYLIYGAALGVADKVYDAMKLQEQNISNYHDDDLFLYHHYGGYYMMHNAIMSGQSTVNSSSDSGGFGGLGGGSGGGGGGAF
ncbi:DUF2207 domain-containing protein [Methanobrevibacter sp.]|uniref:DUF2207 domain-containing protein n=1 Tax=Methanobrevibacter sp. TaxID=66852 RepID=UPI0025EB3339|nr:DUF2207 domain-containing protein [Methanobrevibacter sp.]MBR4447480.1 DUF2207 domain-containing protein [Methanobrevibacter sp.]